MTTRNPDSTVRVLDYTDGALIQLAAVFSGAVPGAPATIVALDAATLAALETITVLVASGQLVGLDAATLAALETITAAVSNFPSDYPDAAVLARVEDVRALLAGTLTVTGPLTDTELRATPLPVSFLADEAGLTDVELRASPVPVSGTVAVTEPVTVDGEVELAAATLAALETVNVANLPATQPVSAVDLDIRDLSEFTDAVRSVDAAEDAALIAAPFTITATGTATLVAAPGVGNGRLRLRRLSPTFAIRSPLSEPILALFVGPVEAQRGNALVGRFDITAAADTHAITLSVDVLDTGGRVTGTVYYVVEP